MPALLDEAIAPRLAAWCEAGADQASRARRRQRADITFGLNGAAWNEDMVLQRYELLFEAGLVPEPRAARGGRGRGLARRAHAS